MVAGAAAGGCDRERAERDSRVPVHVAGRCVLRVSERHRHGPESKALADMLLNDAGVACLSGTAFGSYGDGYLRFSYANSMDNILEAIERIRNLSDRWTTNSETAANV
jgi:aspartate/methionine/tyrosine aminotransferase